MNVFMMGLLLVAMLPLAQAADRSDERIVRVEKFEPLAFDQTDVATQDIIG